MTGTPHSAAAVHQANIYNVEYLGWGWGWGWAGAGAGLGWGWGSFVGSNYAMLTERGRGRVRGVAAE